jgi:hypothetical protein
LKIEAQRASGGRKNKHKNQVGDLLIMSEFGAYSADAALAFFGGHLTLPFHGVALRKMGAPGAFSAGG